MYSSIACSPIRSGCAAFHGIKVFSRNPAQQEALPADILSDAVCEGSYLQLRAGQSEITLIDALTGKKAPEATPILNQLLSRHPDYLIALQTQGKLLNDLRDHRAALSCLERARDLRPDSPRTWSEIGRSWFLLNETQRARAALDEAIRVNPLYLPAWQYLLRMLSLGKSPDGSTWAQRAEKMFPTCYSLALLGVQTLPPPLIIPALLRLLNQFAPGILFNEQALATSAFRQAILPVVRDATASPDLSRAPFPPPAKSFPIPRHSRRNLPRRC